MADKTWKRVEREKCRELGGERRGPTGRDTVDCDDLVKVGVEIKAYKKLVFLTKDWEQAVENAEKVGLTPVLAVREGGRGGRDRVQMRMRDFNGIWSRAYSWYVPVDFDVEYLEGGYDRSYVRFDWKDFVRLYHAAFNNDAKE